LLYEFLLYELWAKFSFHNCLDLLIFEFYVWCHYLNLEDEDFHLKNFYLTLFALIYIYIYIDIDIYTTLVCVYKRLEPLAHRAVVQSPIVILGCCSIVLLLDCSHLSSSILPFPMLFLISLFTAFLEGKGIHSIIICWGSQFLSILCTYSYHISYFFSMLSII